MSRTGIRFSMRGARFGHLATTAVVLAIVLLAASDGALLLQNRALKSALKSERESLLPPIGRRVSPLRGVTAAGLPATIDYGTEQKTTLFFVFSAYCPFCSAAWPTWRSVVEDADPARVRIVFVNIGGPLPADFVASHRLAGVTVLAAVDPEGAVQYNFMLVPDLVEVSRSGTVEGAWTGKPDVNIVARLKRELGRAAPD